MLSKIDNVANCFARFGYNTEVYKSDNAARVVADKNGLNVVLLYYKGDVSLSCMGVGYTPSVVASIMNARRDAIGTDKLASDVDGMLVLVEDCFDFVNNAVRYVA